MHVIAYYITLCNTWKKSWERTDGTKRILEIAI